MHCRSCELLLEDGISKVQGVQNVCVSYQKGEATIGYGQDVPSRLEVERAIREAGYEIGVKQLATWFSRNPHDYRELGLAFVILLALYFAARGLGILDLSLETQKVTYPMALIVGLVAGISTCMALVGGLILGVSARHAERHPEATSWQKFRPHLYFNVGRILGYAALGGLLGILGGFLKLSNTMLMFLTLAVGVVMVVLGLKLTGVSPRLKDASFTLPASLARLFGISRHQKEYSHRSAMMTGALTFFLPCGFTQAMQIYAISTGSFVQGALVMGLFALGTAPALLSIGGLTSVIKGAVARRFYATVGLAVFLFGMFNVGNAMALAGFNPKTVRTVRATNVADLVNGVQLVRMTQKAAAYIPNSFTVRVGVPVRWVITSESSFSCATALVVPSLGISRNLKPGENVIEFTPKSTGSIPFSCSMGMYRGSFTVVDGSGAAAPAAAAQPATNRASGSSCGSGGGGCGCGGGAKRPVPAASASSIVKQAGDVAAFAKVVDGILIPDTIVVEKGKPVFLTITSDEPPLGCMVAFVNRELGINADQAYPGATLIRFTPQNAGEYDLTCPMGMWRGRVRVR
ncbi:hypothetical protein A3E39_01420 [Candidatus Uhrbacteria bacterium RIFCSPHIGHO2_12_FULL_60_25]|uniref:HMA domain-containing protein n=1 Tax=Candidatus Uhrbacteria bacterium RIFCSPHIGHO2_12_FULL_60_25 TaxID=1802399 RepID=A0A1F7UKI5_9BACT|nr:MAG: hypothetical protein A3E39_01420 [Candidatus Uhrbacteria bacterium RIFCSPHIGHO2_12_FULL_60_25]